MSRNMNIRNNGQNVKQQVREPCCPHCSNLNSRGNSSTLLPTNHWLRQSPDPKSPLVCPVLKQTECRYCFEFGHTVSRCPILEAKNKTYATVDRQPLKEKREREWEQREKESVKRTSYNKNINHFATLDESYDNKSVKLPTVNEEFPALHSGGDYRRITINFNTMKYSDVAAKPAVVKPPAPVVTDTTKAGLTSKPKMVKKYTNWADDSSDDEEDTTKAVLAVYKPKMVKKYTNWADDSSDDEEDDLDNFVPDAWDA